MPWTVLFSSVPACSAHAARNRAANAVVRKKRATKNSNTPNWRVPKAGDFLMEKDLQVVGFRIGNETYGVKIGSVREIVRVPEITSVPSAPDLVEGVINLRGKIIPVMDLRKRFGQTEIQPDKKNRILVVELENKFVGLIVNAASEVLKIPPSDIEAPGSVFAEGESGYVTGVGKLKGRLIILLDISKLLQRPEYKRLEEVAEPVASVR